MKVLVYSARPYDKEFLEAANQNQHELHFIEARLEESTAVLARRYPCGLLLCRRCSKPRKYYKQLFDGGTRLVALRATGFNNVDLQGSRRTRHDCYAGIPVLPLCRSRIRRRHDA